MAAWLLKQRVMEGLMELNTLDRRLQSHKTSFVLWVAVMYLLSVVDIETISCHLKDHEIAPSLMRNV